MEKRPYKLAIMGASGVGKTVFLGSYFYANERGMGKKYHIAPLNEKLAAAPGQTESPDEQELNSVQVVNELINILFKGTQIGTHKRVDMSMTVGDRMKVRLFDLPGGFTVDSTRWEDQKIREDLETADGVIFFIPAWDTLHNYAECRKTSTPFDTAISQYIRNEKAGAKEKKADIPIYFLFTKADKLQGADKDVTAEQLLDLWSGLKSASQTGSQRSFFKKGQFDKTFLVTSLGTWLDDRTPPKEEEYQPINVVESMESLFDDMARARRLRDRNSLLKKAAVAAAAALGIFVLATGISYSVQKRRWNGAEKAAQLAAARQNYPEAIKALDDFRAHGAPLGLPLPSFMSPEKDAGAQIEKLRRDYEADSYKGLAGYLQIADAADLPDSHSDSFKQGALAVKEYLTNDRFVTISPEHYATVKRVEQYYTAGALLNETVNSFDDIQNILNRIDMVPANWREPLVNRIQMGLHNWIAAVERNAAAKENEASGSSLQELDKTIAQTRALMNSPWLAEQLRQSLTDQLDTLEGLKNPVLDKIIAAKIATANSLSDPEEAIGFLEEFKAGASLSSTQNKRLQSAIDSQYDAMVKNWISEKTDAAEMRAHLTQYPGMPETAKSSAYQYMQHLGGVEIGDQLQRISSVENLGALCSVWDELSEIYLGNSQALQELQAPLSERFEALLNNDKHEREGIINGELKKNDFENAKHIIDVYSQNLDDDFLKFSSLCDTSKMKSEAENWKKKILERVAEGEYGFLRSQFHTYETTSPSEENLRQLSEKLSDFTQRWPKSSQEVDEVRKVIRYLDAIKGGVDASLTIVSANVPKSYDWPRGKNDLQITLSIEKDVVKNAKTSVVDDNNAPVFNFTVKFPWTADCGPCQLKVEDEDATFNETITKIIIPCSGITGWRKLNGPHTNNGATVLLQVNVSPDCPW